MIKIGDYVWVEMSYEWVEGVVTDVSEDMIDLKILSVLLEGSGNSYTVAVYMHRTVRKCG